MRRIARGLKISCHSCHRGDCQRYTADRQSAPEEEEVFQRLAGLSYVPMRRLSLSRVVRPWR